MGMLEKSLHSIQLMGFRSSRTEFYKDFAQSIRMNEATRDFLAEELRTAAAPKTRDSSKAYALRIMIRRQAIADQSQLSALFGAVMPDSDRLVLSALDDASDKPALLETLVESIESQKKVAEIIKSKIVAPLFVMPIVFAFCYIIATQVLPAIVKEAPEEVWTPFNAAFRGACELVAAYGVTAMIAIGAGMLVLVFRMPRWTGPVRGRLESVSPGIATAAFPVFPVLLPLSIYRNLQVGLLFSALAVMLKAGATLREALQNVRSASQPWMRWHLRRVISYLEIHPKQYSEAFSRGLLSPQMLARLSSMIRTNPNFDQVLIDIGTTGGEKVRAELNKQANAINLMIKLGTTVVIIFMMLGLQSVQMTMNQEMSASAIMKRRLLNTNKNKKVSFAFPASKAADPVPAKFVQSKEA